MRMTVSIEAFRTPEVDHLAVQRYFQAKLTCQNFK